MYYIGDKTEDEKQKTYCTKGEGISMYYSHTCSVSAQNY